jgi:hypothetical protein
LTPEEYPLNPDFFLASQPLTLYRLARARYANLSGVGAALAPGRWNQLGEEAIYTSTEKSVTHLERLAHLPKDLAPSTPALIMKIRVSGKWEGLATRNGHSALTSRSRCGSFWFYRTLAAARFAFSSGRHSFGVGLNAFAVAMPSAIVPAWNVVLYPRAAGFWDHVTLESVEPFKMDPRPFSEHTPL